MRLGITSAGVAELVPPYRIERSQSDHHVLVCTLSGSGAHGGGVIRPGGLFVYPVGYQLYWSDTDWDMVWFHVVPGRFERLDALTEPTTWPFSGGPQLKALMNGLCDEQALGDAHSVRAVEDYADLVAIHLERHLDDGHDPLRADTLGRLAAVWRLVEENPARPWTVTGLAQAYGLSSVQFHRVVGKELGTSPMKKVAEIRLNAACHLLLTTGHTLETIAEAIGFGSSFALSRAFKRHFGSSPKHFRQAHFSKP